MKIDVAIQSFKKPELLLYTLLSLKKVSQDKIDQIWIQDDSDDPEVVDFYKSQVFLNALWPWKINIKANTQRGGWWFTPVDGLYPAYLSPFKRLLFSLRAKYRGTGFSLKRENSRYQWAIDNTDKSYLFIIHDDIVFYEDLIESMIYKFENNTNLAIVGDLGQCWRCEYSRQGCNSDKVNSGYRPSLNWPDIEVGMSGHRWPCRINEWCCVISTSAASSIEKKYNVLFGGYDNHGDVAAYWFSLINEENFDFEDIAPSDTKKKLFLHADGGSGHSVWVDQGDGKKVYDKNVVIKNIKYDFGIDI